MWALKFPTAPFNLASNLRFLNNYTYYLTLYVKLAISFPTVVGVATYPWVLDNMGTSAY